MSPRAKERLLDLRLPESWYLVAAILAAASALATALNQPLFVGLAVFAAAWASLVLGVALHSAPPGRC